MKIKNSLQVITILLVGLILTWAILKTGHTPDLNQTEENHDQGEAEEHEDRGPNGGRMFSEGGLNVEVTIFEEGVPPQFRVYVTDDDGKAIPQEEVTLTIKLQRLDRTDVINFRPSGPYLLGEKTVEEPHSFDVIILAVWQGQKFEWSFSQIEARVELSEQAIKNAGITLNKAGPVILENSIRFTGEIGLNEERVAHVIPRLDGVARKIYKDLGDQVRKGETLAILESRELADAKSNYLMALKQSHLSKADLERESLVYENTSQMLALLDAETELDTLYQKLEGLVIGENRSRLLPAYAKIIHAKSVYLREKGLFEKKISSESEYLLALEEYKSAEARYLSLREQIEYDGSWTLLQKKRASEVSKLNLKISVQKLFALGMVGSDVESLSQQDNHTFTQYELKAPIDGMVIQKHITSGEAVKGDDNIFLLANLSDVWVNIAVPEKDLKSVRLGQKVKVILNNLDLEGSGILSYLGSVIEERTRTVTARVVIQNPRKQWRPGSFVTVELIREERRVSIGVPVEAIQTIRDWSVVFVKYGNNFEARPLELGERDGVMVEVLHGLRRGEQYVATNSFTVKAEIGKAGATHSH